MEREIESQLAFSTLNLPKQVDSSKCVMTGSGDSYIAASIASYLSNRRAICCLPPDLILNHQILEGKELYIVSVSGRTAYNISAAKVAKKMNVKTIAITANSNSELARLCDRVVSIDYRIPKVVTSGSAGFLSTMLSCISLLAGVKVSKKNLQCAHQAANIEVNKLVNQIPHTPSSILYLAEGLLHPVAWYGSLKINEVLGVKSSPYSVEEYCHAPLFSIKKGDAIIILGGTKNKKSVAPANEIIKKLEKLKFSVFLLDLSQSSSIGTLLQAIFSVQLFALRKAKKMGMTECFFVQNQDLLNISSACIY
jgi:glucosamine--fructose-6-phosphate aminotransferase (isomerizing)